jgi:hypothetical protein
MSIPLEERATEVLEKVLKNEKNYITLIDLLRDVKNDIITPKHINNIENKNKINELIDMLNKIVRQSKTPDPILVGRFLRDKYNHFHIYKILDSTVHSITLSNYYVVGNDNKISMSDCEFGKSYTHTDIIEYFQLCDRNGQLCKEDGGSIYDGMTFNTSPNDTPINDNQSTTYIHKAINIIGKNPNIEMGVKIIGAENTTTAWYAYEKWLNIPTSLRVSIIEDNENKIVLLRVKPEPKETKNTLEKLVNEVNNVVLAIPFCKEIKRKLEEILKPYIKD